MENYCIIVRWVSATSRPFHGFVVHHQSSGQISPQSLPPVTSPPNSSSKQEFKLKKKMINEGGEGEDSRKIGSSPPKCEHKCYGCIPCEAIQVPTNTKKQTHFLGVKYANYEPEGWKCKCGPSFYTP
ncbi:hypothetical protein Ddye_013002 [Dipteronia dyeriana]|uniref:Epidermal patterning factor-like protein n=1 Tax=Dipteronia dyeriana TaxID=168575 RepID=A0AAD9X5B6_9ROSI|nr:hypothetical protein Ddye_013002 [Dipteronia dyeriana]